MFWIRRAVATAIVLALAGVTAGVAWDTAAASRLPATLPSPSLFAGHLGALPDASAPSPAADAVVDLRPRDWQPPSWHPNPAGLSPLAGMGGAAVAVATPAPRLSSRSAYVYDLDSGEVLLARRADEIWPVASLTKLVSGLAMASASPDLEQVHCVDPGWYPTRNGARSKFHTDTCYRGWDALGAALVASDNRGAFGMQVASGLPYGDFIDRMDAVSAALSMASSTWSDPSGLEDENLSTARDMARAAVAASAHPVLSVAASAPSWEIERMDAAGRRELRTTNRLARRSGVEVLAAKTGFTSTAGYCYAATLRTASGRRVAIALLGSWRSSQRWGDVDRILTWLDRI